MNHMGTPQVAVIQEELSSEKNSLLNLSIASPKGAFIGIKLAKKHTSINWKVEVKWTLKNKLEIEMHSLFLFSLFNTKFTNQFFITLLSFLKEPNMKIVYYPLNLKK